MSCNRPHVSCVRLLLYFHYGRTWLFPSISGTLQRQTQAYANVPPGTRTVKCCSHGIRGIATACATPDRQDTWTFRAFAPIMKGAEFKKCNFLMKRDKYGQLWMCSGLKQRTKNTGRLDIPLINVKSIRMGDNAVPVSAWLVGQAPTTACGKMLHNHARTVPV